MCTLSTDEDLATERAGIASAEGALVGFYAESAVGKLTNHGQRNHMNAIVATSAGKEAGLRAPRASPQGPDCSCRQPLVSEPRPGIPCARARGLLPA